MKSIYLSLLILLSSFVYGQLKPIGSWTDHLPYQSGVSMASSGTQLFCGTKTGIFIYNTNDRSITKWSKVNKLNDVVVQKLAYDPTSQSLIVIYENANIDIINNGVVTNLPFLENYRRVTNKTVNDIYIKESKAYLACGFGIIVIDLPKKEISDSYIFTENEEEININSVIVSDNQILASTESNLYAGNLNDNLLDFSNWSTFSQKAGYEFKKLFFFKNQIHFIAKAPNNNLDSAFKLPSFQAEPSLSNKTFITLSNSLDNKLTFITENLYQHFDSEGNILNSYGVGTSGVFDSYTINNELYVLNNFHPLLHFNNQGELVSRVKPNGPFERNVFDIDAYNGQVWSVSGGHNGSYGNANTFVRIYSYIDNEWTSYIEFGEPSLSGLYDVLSVKINPENEENVVFGSWGIGLLEYKSNLPFIRYTNENTGLIEREALDGWVGTGETEFDEDNNLWVVNTYTSKSLAVRKTDGTWRTFDFSEHISNEEIAVKELVITESGQKWVAYPRLNQIVVFDDKGTIDNTADDESILLKQEAGQGNLPGIRGITMEVDLNGQVWIGTSDGIAVYYSPENVFEAGQKDAERILVDDGQNVEILFESTTINDIEISGNNQKWIATDGFGVFLLSEDGQEVIENFTVENSPLVSNNVLKIAADNKSGEVYFATGQGIVSYKGNSIEGKENLSEVNIFPNPIRPDYEGPISISGLMDNTTVKITDVNGRLINELISRGGQVIWDGTNFENQEVSSGVYLIFSSGENMEENLKTHIGKILYQR